MTDEITFTGQSGATYRYWINQPLGRPGRFGRVYAGERRDGMPVAVKVVDKQDRRGTLDHRLLRREIDIGRRVAGSGSDILLPIVDAAETGDALLLVMHRAEGALGDIPLPMSEAHVVTAMTDIATGLRDLHAISIIHRDLKPGNVLRHNRRWKLADFGIARDQDIGTQDPTFLGAGSHPYMAPEIWTSNPLLLRPTCMPSAASPLNSSPTPRPTPETATSSEKVTATSPFLTCPLAMSHSRTSSPGLLPRARATAPKTRKRSWTDSAGSPCRATLGKRPSLAVSPATHRTLAASPHSNPLQPTRRK